MRLLFDYIKQHKKTLIGALILAAINQTFSLLDPQIFRIIIDRYAIRAGQIPAEEFIHGVLIWLLAYMGVALASRIAKNFQDYYVNVITQRVGTKLYATGVNHSFSLPFGVFEDQRSGEILLKLQKARTDSQALIQSAINVVFLTAIGIIFVLVYAFIVHPFVGLAFFSVIPIITVVTFLISRRIKDAQKEIVRESAALAGATTETIRNVELVKSLGLEGQEANRLNAVNEKILRLELRQIVLIRYLSFSQGTLVNAVRAGIMFLMLWLMATNSMTLGEFFSLLFYSFYIFNPLSALTNVTSQYQEARASLEALQEILSIPPEEKPTKPRQVESLRSIEFSRLSFRYSQGDTASIKNVSFGIRAGETAAFVGPSGSGKSTLVKLILGLYQPTECNLFLNGIDSREIDYENFRQKIGYVSQDTQLFAGTIRENLLFINPAASDDDCLLALKHAAALPIVERGDKGLDTKIGEGGIKISGGEKQRLAIARALLRNPELIIFDEATSSLDSITEKAITQTIQNIIKLKPNLIIVLVAHRLSTVAHANTIYVFEKGKIVERGNHNNLLKKKGLYAAFWR